ncbi:MAG: MBL fold metallo-hydrolase [Candidatus Binatus sp.]|uniref:MBL fold metallo-hydrolase n=1 Tax=Candidatus Binatus sp. TaxID=2811406 RepID=UPI003BAE392A
MSKWQFTKGLHDLGRGAYAYLQPSGTWGYSNAGLIADGDQSLLVDTLFDERLTAEMLAVMQDATGFGADRIGVVVNTHSNGDHTFGNRLAKNAVIIASEAAAHEMREEGNPQLLAQLMKNTDAMGEVGSFFKKIFGAFDFAGVTFRLPDRTFTGEETLKVGDKQVRLIQVGPAHTAGDVSFVPANRVVYTGDILFIDGTPIAWAGPVSNWIKACDRILGLDVDVVIPGHGPITDKAGVKRMQDYLVHVDKEARRCHAAGMSSWEAAQNIPLGSFGGWEDPERLAVTVDTIFREINDDHSSRNILELFGRMAQLHSHYARTSESGH